jgi:hypothetical protein
MPEFCEGVETWTECLECPLHSGQHPCWPAKVIYWQTDGKLRLGAEATTSRRSNRDKPDPPPREPNGSFDHAIPKDHRGLPYLDRDGVPYTRKRIANLGSDFERRLREIRAGKNDTALRDKIATENH